MVPRETWVSQNFGLISKSCRRFLMGLEVSFLSDFSSQSLEFFLPTGLEVFDLSLFLSVWSSGAELSRVHDHSLLN